MAYTATYATSDIASIVVDFIGSFLAGLAQSATPLVWTIIAGMIITLIGGVVYAVKHFGR